MTKHHCQGSERHARTVWRTAAKIGAVVAAVGMFAVLVYRSVVIVDGVGPEIGVSNDMVQLAVAAEAFKEKFGFYPPSRFHLVESGAYGTSRLDADSEDALRKMFPGLQYPVDWNGDGTAGNADVVLEGDQCLVFFLGGIPSASGVSPPGTLGFSTNPSNPASRGGDRILFFLFRSDRLERQEGGFFSYGDGFEAHRPYAYFSAGGQRDGYSRYGGSDCPRLGVSPYARSWGQNPSYYNPDCFQIISAGRDGQFGPGTVSDATTWSPATAGAIDPRGRDDISNFYSRRLGTPDR